MKYLCVLVSGLLGIVALLGARIYHITVHPEWTEMQSLRMLWLPYTVGLVAMLLAFIIMEKTK
jgi:hypothetical protein